MDDFIQEQYDLCMCHWSTKEAAFIFVLVGDEFASELEFDIE